MCKMNFEHEGRLKRIIRFIYVHMCKIRGKGMDVNRIVKGIDTSISEAKRIIDTLSEDEIIELRAELEASKTHFGKWMNSFMVFLLPF